MDLNHTNLDKRICIPGLTLSLIPPKFRHLPFKSHGCCYNVRICVGGSGVVRLGEAPLTTGGSAEANIGS